MNNETDGNAGTRHHRIRSYCLRSGRMSDAQRRAYETLFPRYGIPFGGGTLDSALVFANQNPLVIEIGFGMGAATALIAAANPALNYLGLEVHRPGIGKLLWDIERRGLRNLRIIEHDAVETLETMIPACSVAGFHIFFPDPWPKKRHHKRRLISRPFTDLLASRLVPGGYLYMVTDWAEYGGWALAELGATKGLINAYDGFAPPQTWRPETRFERKGIEKQHAIRELYFKQG